jgi:hypothetical protein
MSQELINNPNQENIQEIHDPSGVSIKGNHLGKQAEKIRRPNQWSHWHSWLRSVLFVAIVFGLVAALKLPTVSLAGVVPYLLGEAFGMFRKKPT